MKRRSKVIFAPSQKGFQLSFNECLVEIDAMKGLSKHFVTPETPGIFDEHRSTLEGIRSSGSEAVFPWEISQARPLRTIETHGYEPGNQGGTAIFAELSGIWEIRCLKPKGKKSAPQGTFAIAGKASTVTRIMQSVPGGSEELGKWRIEVATYGAPGPFFHIQIEADRTDPPFPKWLPIPRLSAPLATPTSAFEYVLAELFQDDWLKEVERASDHVKRWRPIQTQRLRSVMKWQMDKLDTLAAGSPWTILKTEEPPENLLVNT